MPTITATTRTEIGTNAVKKIRRAGNIPGIVYGHGIDPQSISVSEHEVEMAIQHGERLFDLTIDGKPGTVMFKAVQWDTFGNDVLHVDFARVDLTEIVEISVPVILAGTPEGAKEGGVLQQQSSEINISCQVQNMPEEIKIFVTEMKKDDRMLLGDIDLPEGATLLDNPEDILCQVVEIAEEEEAVEGEEASDGPEVIGAKPDEETTEE